MQPSLSRLPLHTVLAAFLANLVLVSIVNWLVTLIRGTPSAALARFLSAYVRYSVHVNSFLYVIANPFPVRRPSVWGSP